VLKLLEKKPDERFASAAEVLDALAAIPDPSTTVTFHAAPPAAPTPGAAAGGRPRILPILGVGSLMVAAIIAVLLWYPFAVEPPGAIRVTPEDTLESVHLAIRDRNWMVFSECFDETTLKKVTREQFLARAGQIADLGYRIEIPLRGAASKGTFFRVGSSPALATILGKSPGATLRIGMKHRDDGFRIVKVGADSDPGRRTPGPGPGPGGGRGGMEERVIRARVDELFENLDVYAGVLLTRLEKEGRIERNQSPGIKERLKALTAEGPFEHRIINEESTFKGGRPEVVVSCPKLAELLGLEDDRFSVELGRRGSGRGGRTPRIRPLDR
jgi:hypothetical protein